MDAQTQIKIAKKQIATASESKFAGAELTLSEKAIAAVLDRIIARQNRIAAQSTFEDME